MKLGKRSLIMALSLVVAMTLSVFGTVAYLTSTASATNTFTVGDVQIELDETDVTPEGDPTYDLDGDGTPDVSVDEDGNMEPLPDSGLTEDDLPDDFDIDEDGNLIIDDDDPIAPERTDEGNKYHVVPGEEYVKDPTVTVKDGSEESYVRILVTLTNVTPVLEALGCESFGDIPALIIPDVNTEFWSLTGYDADPDADNVTYEYRYDGTVSGKDGEVVLPALFETFTVPVTVNNEGLKAFENMDMVVEGQAIQAAALADADAAWAAFDGQMN